jgi:membrane protein DedA with SNARE-associated domain
MLKQLFQPLIAWYLGALKTGGYALIVLLMALEGSFLPLPSEFIIPPAAHLAWAGGGLNLFQFHFSGWPAQAGIVIAGALGSWLGAAAMYWSASQFSFTTMTHLPQTLDPWYGIHNECA